VGLRAVSAEASRLWQETAECAIVEGVSDVEWVQADLARCYALLDGGASALAEAEADELVGRPVMLSPQGELNLASLD